MLAVRDLAFSHDSRKLLRGANLTVGDDERIALVGPNGAGKSTLLSLFAGTLKPDTGVVERGRGQRLGLLTQTPHLPLEETALRVAESGLPELFALKAEYDALADRMDTLDDAGMERLTALSEQIDARGGFDIAHRIDEVLTRLGVRARQELTGSLSGGERRRLDLARLMLAAPDVMLLDEPTNHLDAQGMTFLASLLRKHRGPLILVSHDRAFIDDVASSIVELEDGVLVPYTPPTDRVSTLYDHYLEQKLLREDIAVRSAHKKSRLFLRELAWLRAGTPARTTKQTARIDRAHALATEVDEQVARVRAHQKKVELEAAKNARLGKTIITFDDVAVGRGERTLFTGFTLAVVAGQRLGVVGENGSGKSTLLNAILTAAGMKAAGDPSVVVPTNGRVIIGKNTRIGVFDQQDRKSVV